MELNCLEQVLEDVVRVDVVLNSECNIEVPYQIPEIISTSGTVIDEGDVVDRIGQPVLSFSYAGSDHDCEIESAPTLKQTPKKSASGNVITHELSIPVSSGFESVREGVQVLISKGFNVILTVDDGIITETSTGTHPGTRYLLYSLPNTCDIQLDEQDINQKSTVKVTLQSMSHIIRLI